MEQSPSWEATSFSATQEILHILWNSMVHCRIHKKPPTGPYPEPYLCLFSIAYVVPQDQSKSGALWSSWHGALLRWGGVSISLEGGGPQLVGCSRLLIQCIRSYPPHLVAVLYPQPEGAPCCGNRDPLIQINVKYLLRIEPYRQQLHSHSLHT
jgi:hypothetical protein